MWRELGRPGTLTDRIVEQVEGLVESKQLRPGDQLPAERDMAKLLAVSRPSLREAIRILATQGRVIVRHGQGVFIADPPSERQLRGALASVDMSLDELYAMREVLEVPAAGWAAARRTRTDLDAMRSRLDELDQAVASEVRDFSAIASYDAQFHLCIVEAAGNRFMRQTVTVLQEMLNSGMQTTLVIPGRLAASQIDHRRILTALEQGDSTAARQAMRHHIRSAHRAARRRFEFESPGSVSDRPTG